MRTVLLPDDIALVARVGFPKTAERIATEISNLNEEIKRLRLEAQHQKTSEFGALLASHK